ncbi:MAG: helix-turn-helix transcriptional regulator [Clostridia bacterium]|nr:helix-turn-helix transcriptional regulator [Clostridia bacterium]
MNNQHAGAGFWYDSFCCDGVCTVIWSENTRPIYSYSGGREVQVPLQRPKLLYSQLSAKEVAPECGFNDMYYFSRWFSKHTGCSSKEYRKNIRL